MMAPRITPRSVSSRKAMGAPEGAAIVAIKSFPSFCVGRSGKLLELEPNQCFVTPQHQPAAVDRQGLLDELRLLILAVHLAGCQVNRRAIRGPRPFGRLRHRAIVELILKMSVGIEL